MPDPIRDLAARRKKYRKLHAMKGDAAAGSRDLYQNPNVRLNLARTEKMAARARKLTKAGTHNRRKGSLPRLSLLERYAAGGRGVSTK